MMAKSSKKVPARQPKPITDFFKRKTPSTPASSQPTSSQSQPASSAGPSQGINLARTLTPPLNTKATHINPQSSISDTPTTVESTGDASSSLLKAKSRTVMAAVEIVSPRKGTMSANVSQYSSSSMNSHSQSHKDLILPNPKYGTTSSQSKSKPPGTSRRKTKFNSDSDTDRLETVIYTEKSTTPQPANAPIHDQVPLRPKENVLQSKSNSRKKPRLSTPDTCVISVIGDIVPSSQSDEREMVLSRLSKRDPKLTRKVIDEWRQMALPPATGAELCDPSDDDMQVDVIPTASSPLTALSTPTSSLDTGAFRGSRASTVLTSPIFEREDSPSPVTQPSHLPPLPASPEILDPATKVARIIADIKAKAYATSMSSPPDSPPLEFKEELDDSSDEGDCILWSPVKGKGKSILMSPRPSLSTSRHPPHDREASPSPTSSKNPSASSKRMRTAPNRGPVILTEGLPVAKKGKAKAYSPLDELLKEKRLADKHGKGDEAFRLAEIAMASRDDTADEMSLEDDSVDWGNEDAARMAVMEREQIDLEATDPVASGSKTGENIPTVEDQERLLGEGRGDAIKSILDGDRANKEKEAEKFRGVPLWPSAKLDEPMAVDVTIPALDNPAGHPLLRLLNTAISRQDFAQAALLLNSGALASVNLTECPSIIPYLCELALSYETTLNAPAFQTLCHIWDKTSHLVPTISFSSVLSCLVRLGAKQSALSSCGWPVNPSVQPEAVDAQQRDNILYRLVGLLTSSARSGRIPNEEVPDMIIAMLLIANDPSTSPYLERDIMVAIDEVARSIAPEDDLSPILEAAVCSKILQYTATLTPINKAFIVTLLGAGTGRIRRIARWTANAIIIDQITVSPNHYCDLPPLLPVLDHLLRNADRGSEDIPGKFELHEETDYVNLRYYTQVLAVAVSDVRAYVNQERKVRRSKPPAIKPSENPPVMVVQSIHTTMDSIHSRISDTRATNLDRSRAKAALKEVSMRIHYQYLTAIRESDNGGTGKPRINIQQYFTPKKQNASSA